jgi:adenylate cyclase
MATEIERKFFVCSDAWRAQVHRSERYRQGYLANTALSSIRVRVCEDRAWLNIKQAVPGRQRHEYDYPIPIVDAREMLANLCEGHRIEKTRYHVYCGSQLWEIDEFEGANLGLTVAEIELESAQQAFERPAWLGREITDDPRYYNNMLASHPYSQWT